MTDAAAERLESLLTHLSRDVEQMHEVLLAQTAELAVLRRRVDRLESRADRLEAEGEEDGGATEKPPHY